MLVGRAWAGGAWAAGRVGTPGGPSLVGPEAQGALLPGVAGDVPGGPSLVAGEAVVGATSGGNCSIRGATRRRHAVAMRLMVQNPPVVWQSFLPGQMGGIAALGVRYAGDTPWGCV